ncbi:MAG: hypothetical protein MZV63_16700 [Marinilabiliales bacterium]|nr:hypothetical protein [Marinilabiliales bacterium]
MIKAIWQGGEEHETRGVLFNSSSNYKDAIGRQFVESGFMQYYRALPDNS